MRPLAELISSPDVVSSPVLRANTRIEGINQRMHKELLFPRTCSRAKNGSWTLTSHVEASLPPFLGVPSGDILAFLRLLVRLGSFAYLLPIRFILNGWPGINWTPTNLFHIFGFLELLCGVLGSFPGFLLFCCFQTFEAEGWWHTGSRQNISWSSKTSDKLRREAPGQEWLTTRKSRVLRSAECASLTTRVLHSSPLQSVNGVRNCGVTKKRQWKSPVIRPTKDNVFLICVNPVRVQKPPGNRL